MSDSAQISKSNLVPTDKVTDFSIGFRNIKEAAGKALYNIKDEESGIVTSNTLCLNMAPRYVRKDRHKDHLQVDPTTSLGDVIASLVHISSRLDILENELGIIKRKQDIYESAAESGKEEIEHMGQHVTAMENNLRCLRQTLTFGEFEEDDLPDLEGCPLANSAAKQKTQNSDAPK